MNPLADFEDMTVELAGVSTIAERQEILEKYLVGGHPQHRYEVRNLVQLALSPYVKFHMVQLPDVEAQPDILNGEQAYSLCLQILECISKRLVTGDAAKAVVSKFMGAVGEKEARAFVKILHKDLRCGASISTMNKVIPGLVPVFSCQLAASEMPDVSKLSYPVIVEPKYDGVRTIAIKRNGVLMMMSRNGKPFENFEEIEWVLEKMPDNAVFDGEVLPVLKDGETADQGFARLMRRCKASRGKNIESAPDLVYQVFDGMSLADWEKSKSPATLLDRKAYITGLYDMIECTLVETPNQNPPRSGEIKLSPASTCHDEAEVYAIYNDLVAKGFEGIIIKEITGRYTFKRNDTWMKLKPFDTIDLTVRDAASGTGKYSESLGALLCEGDHNGKSLSAMVGSGFTDDVRHKLWADHLSDKKGAGGAFNPKRLHGKIVEIRYQDITQAKDADTYSLRFPTFVRFREQDAGGKV